MDLLVVWCRVSPTRQKIDARVWASPALNGKLSLTSPHNATGVMPTSCVLGHLDVSPLSGQEHVVERLKKTLPE
jgi:hypothetical protein